MEDPDIIFLNEATVGWTYLPAKTLTSDWPVSPRFHMLHWFFTSPTAEEITEKMDHILYSVREESWHKDQKTILSTPEVLADFCKILFKLSIDDHRFYINPHRDKS